MYSLALKTCTCRIKGRSASAQSFVNYRDQSAELKECISDAGSFFARCLCGRGLDPTLSKVQILFCSKVMSRAIPSPYRLSLQICQVASFDYLLYNSWHTSFKSRRDVIIIKYSILNHTKSPKG